MHLNQIPEITSKEMYANALKLFNVEIRKSGRGHIVVVTDDFGNPIRYPIRLSNFKEGPGFYKAEITNQTLNPNIQYDNTNIHWLNQVFKVVFIQGLNPKEKHQRDKKQMIKRRKGRKI